MWGGKKRNNKTRLSKFSRSREWYLIHDAIADCNWAKSQITLANPVDKQEKAVDFTCEEIFARSLANYTYIITHIWYIVKCLCAVFLKKQKIFLSGDIFLTRAPFVFLGRPIFLGALFSGPAARYCSLAKRWVYPPPNQSFSSRRVDEKWFKIDFKVILYIN